MTEMTEVWEEKSKSGSEDAEGGDAQEKQAGGAKDKELATKDFEKDPDINKLREELMADMEVIKEERRRLTEERNAFRTEMRNELKNMRAEKMDMDSQHNQMVESAGVVVLDMDETMGPQDEIETIEKELDRIEPSVEVDKPPSKVEIEDLSMELQAIESELNTKVDFAAITKMSEDYEASINQIKNSIHRLNRKVDEVIVEMEESGRRVGSFRDMIREIKKLDEKTDGILEEIGFGASLNVTKIPPNILESVYESTIEDLINKIHRNYGSHDAERIITRTIEDIRTRTSGSELFYYDGRMMKTRNLSKTIQNKLISAKQVQTTYNELLRKFLEYLPGYKPKNFRAMIKLKSQEYAVDKATFLMDKFQAIREDIWNVETMMGNVTNRQNSIDKDIKGMLESKIEREDLGRIQALIEDVKARQSAFEVMLKGITEQIEGDKKTLSGKIEDLSQHMKEFEKTFTQKGKEDKTVLKENDEGKSQDYEKPSDYEHRILSKIPTNGFTLNRIKKEFSAEITEEKIEECLQSLTDKGLLSTLKRGRHTIYVKEKHEKIEDS